MRASSLPEDSLWREPPRLAPRIRAARYRGFFHGRFSNKIKEPVALARKPAP